ncbi:fimbria/pilus outer membrane usher protein [Pseudomonas otitidis]|uniref:fimbria/pilus outer membrane usher protein n=1 Tax=Metapseudomonas otitidis TaxID=319939 RepID=UPI002E7B2C95|nr:fimbria/pilus outer membrane usher protein [Pseudomonas otitidis]MEE1895407.1 fimbria/pilus outer membrane usher protein [Pseudomonas otitidis]
MRHALQRPCRGLLSALLLGGMLVVLTRQGHSDERVLFDDSFLPPEARNFDLSQFEDESPVVPGNYQVDIRLNERIALRREMEVASDARGAFPCLPPELLELIGVDPAHLRSIEPATCGRLEDQVDGAQARFDMAELVLELQVPQVALRRNAYDYVDRTLWDEGATAAILGYTLNASHQEQTGSRSDSLFLNLDGGLNLGRWRLRHQGSQAWQSGATSAYRNAATYLQHDLDDWGSQLEIGEVNSSGQLLPGVPLSGLHLHSDPGMLPYSQRNFAPVFRGVARTQARIQVWQGATLLKELNVAPGPFELDDLAPPGRGGDLEVRVLEADGSEQRFALPYSPAVELLRPGQVRFSLAAGRLRDATLKHQPLVIDGVFRRGLDNRTTAYLGSQASSDYSALMIGAAFNTPLGAVATDLTHSRAQIHGQHEAGKSLGLAYSRSWPAGGPALALELRHAPSPGYQSLSSAAQRQNQPATLPADARPAGLRDRATANLTLDTGPDAQLSGGLLLQRDWQAPRWARQYQVGYTQRFRSFSLSLDVIRAQDAQGQPDDQARLSLSVPLGNRLGGSQSLSAAYTRRRDGTHDERLSLRGSAGESRQLAYTLSTSRNSQGSNASSLGGSYQSSRALLSGAVSQGDDYRTTSLGLTGSLLAHPEGITLTPMQGDTFAVLVAPGGAGARVAQQPGLALDGQGQAVVAGLQPYQMNELVLDPAGAADSVEFEETEQRIAPRSGAVVLVRFSTRSGNVLLARGYLPDGAPLPFAASLQNEQGQALGVVGQGGLIYLRLDGEPGTLRANWGPGANQQCTLPVPQPLPAADEPLRDLTCHP